MVYVNIQSFRYPASEKTILSEVAFELKKGECLSVLGQSGCGKSTLLHLVYGVLDLNKGTIFYGKKQLFGPSHNLIPGHNFMKLVSQQSNLMPFTSVAENVSEHLTRHDRAEDDERIDELLSAVGLLDIKNQKVKLLSGGQKQRVALAKALANTPEVLLLDEPFSSIDTFLKNKLRRNLFAYLKKHNISCITATHDAEEALAFSDKLLVLKDGNVLQFGTPAAVYASATSVYEKGFYGEISAVPAGILSEKELLLFPHQLSVSEKKTNLKVQIKRSYFKGHAYLVSCEWNNKIFFFEYDKILQKDAFVYLNIV